MEAKGLAGETHEGPWSRHIRQSSVEIENYLSIRTLRATKYSSGIKPLNGYCQYFS